MLGFSAALQPLPVASFFSVSLFVSSSDVLLMVTLKLLASFSSTPCSDGDGSLAMVFISVSMWLSRSEEVVLMLKPELMEALPKEPPWWWPGTRMNGLSWSISLPTGSSGLYEIPAFPKDPSLPNVTSSLDEIDLLELSEGRFPFTTCTPMSDALLADAEM